MRWGLALLAVGAAFLANRAIPNGSFPAPFFIAAVMITAHFGGRGPAVLAFFVAGALLDYFYIPPFGTFVIQADFRARAHGRRGHRAQSAPRGGLFTQLVSCRNVLIYFDRALQNCPDRAGGPGAG